MPSDRPGCLRSQAWFDNSDNPGMTALHLERYLVSSSGREGDTPIFEPSPKANPPGPELNPKS